MKHNMNIVNKEFEKMRNPADLIPSSLHGLIPVAAAVCLTFAGTLAAQENAPAAAPAPAPAPAQEQSAASAPKAPSPAPASEYAEILSREQKEIYSGLAKADALIREEEFDKCMDKIEEVKALIEKYNGGKPNVERSVMLEKAEKVHQNCAKTFASTTYEKARETYLNQLSNRDLAEASKECKKIIVNLTMAKFMYYTGAKGGDSEKLMEVIRKSLDREFAEKADKLIESCSKISRYADLSTEASLENIDPGFEKRQRDIQVYYREGEQLYRQRRYMQARDKIEQILILDPFNDRAAQLLMRIYRKLYAIADMRQYNELLRDQGAVEWLWMENVPREQALRPDDTSREYADSSSPLFEKAKLLIIPSVEFNELSVTDAIDFLRRKSKEVDPDRSGVQIMTQGLSKMQAADGFARTVTFALQNIPLLDAIHYLCLNTGLKFRINEKRQVIVIGPEEEISKGDTKDEIYIPIRSATVNRMINYKRETTSDKSDDDNGEFTAKGGLGTTVAETFTQGMGAAMAKRGKLPDYSGEIRKYFESLGFSFPEGTFIAYEMHKNRLRVRHTPEKLRQLELLIREIDIENPLVLIEAKVMEIGMNDLEELGFDWTLTHQDESPHWSFAVTSPIRAAAGSDNVLINNMNILPNFGPGGTWSLFLTVNAIDRTDRAEVLCTPKIMSKSGEEAIIRMVREMYFPESWSEPEVTTSCGTSVAIEPSVPEFGESTDIGVIFTARPVVSPNNYTITLTLKPQVVDLVGWSDYSYEIVIGNFGSTNANQNAAMGANTEARGITLKMPEISRREVETNVKVYDGQSVVIGGMLTDRQIRRDDQYPILGDIPILGRLFTNDSTFIEKDNLLVSVTSRLISGDGLPLRSNTANGLPDFRR